MDITQLMIIAGTLVGVVIMGLLAIVPTMIELPRDHDQDTPTSPTPLRPRPRSHRGGGAGHGSVKLAA